MIRIIALGRSFMPASTRSFIPAAGHDFALPLYDPLVSLAGADARRQLLIDRARLSAGQRVLDVGCGTGTLAIAIKRAYPASKSARSTLIRGRCRAPSARPRAPAHR
jgi:hypothetical protein